MSLQRTLLLTFIPLFAWGVIGCQKTTKPAASSNSPHVQARKLTTRPPAASLPTQKIASLPSAVVLHIPAGSFWMGSTTKDKFRFVKENPKHKVTLTTPFLAWKSEVTQQQYKTLMKTNPSRFQKCGGKCPVERVSWHDAARFANALSKLQKKPACFVCKSGKCSLAPAYQKGNYHKCKGWRLPTEAEWEYMAWAGSSNAGKDKFAGVAMNKRNINASTVPVQNSGSNSWGLLGMKSNVFEWTLDYKYRKYSTQTVTNPLQSAPAAMRVMRGGCWFLVMWKTRISCREWMLPSTRSHLVGFRPVRSL